MFHYTPHAVSGNRQKYGANIIKPMQTGIYQNINLNGSVNSEEHLKKYIKNQAIPLIQAYIYPFMSSKANPTHKTVPFTVLSSHKREVHECQLTSLIFHTIALAL